MFVNIFGCNPSGSVFALTFCSFFNIPLCIFIYLTLYCCYLQMCTNIHRDCRYLSDYQEEAAVILMSSVVGFYCHSSPLTVWIVVETWSSHLCDGAAVFDLSNSQNLLASLLPLWIFKHEIFFLKKLEMFKLQGSVPAKTKQTISFQQWLFVGWRLNFSL